MFEWDENKRKATLAKRSIDFLDMIEILMSRHVLLEARSDVERRQIAVGVLDGQFFSVVFTMRGENYRIITARKARRDEREKYQALYAGTSSGHEE